MLTIYTSTTLQEQKKNERKFQPHMKTTWDPKQPRLTIWYQGKKYKFREAIYKKTLGHYGE
jgi:hypothetical protein